MNIILRGLCKRTICKINEGEQMTARELIERLLEDDLDKEVLIPDIRNDEYVNIKEIDSRSNKYIYLDKE